MVHSFHEISQLLYSLYASRMKIFSPPSTSDDEEQRLMNESVLPTVSQLCDVVTRLPSDTTAVQMESSCLMLALVSVDTVLDFQLYSPGEAGAGRTRVW